MTDFSDELEANIIEAVHHFDRALLDGTSRSVCRRINNRHGKRHDTLTIAKELNRLAFLGTIRNAGATSDENLKVYKAAEPIERWRATA